MKKIYKQLLLLGLVVVGVLGSLNVLADGSRDLYPSGKTGRRAMLYTGSTTPQSWPFPNEGFHYVYAKAGERITMASSAQNNGSNSRIRLYAPDGTLLVNDNTVAGQISNRAAELAGPRLFGQGAGGNRYEPPGQSGHKFLFSVYSI